MAKMNRNYELPQRTSQAEVYGMEFYYNCKGTNHETKCSICGDPIQKGEKQIEFMAGRYGPTAIPYLHHTHRLCFLAELARMFAEEGDSLVEMVTNLIPEIVLNRIKG